MNVSSILFNRLNVKDDEKEHSIYSKTQKKDTMEKIAHRQTYANWLRVKDAERRLKRKLITQAQTEVKEQLL